ncbi:hypothetical protein EJ02DRAFT_455158, partial [Clathrospora elynae]
MAVPTQPGPNSTTTPTVKQTRSRKVGNADQAEQGRAGSSGGVMLAKEQTGKASSSTPKKITSTPVTPDDTSAAAGANRQRRKPRKLNKEPTSTTTAQEPAKASTTSKPPIEVPSSSELEALKSRVRGLESKVEELYKTGAITDSRPARSPRRRGKGRKASSAAQVPTLGNNTSRVQEVDDDEEGEEADEELVRLEGELEVARQDLESYHPRTRRTMSGETEDVEEIPRDAVPGVASSSGGAVDRQVTLSGSYRIPIPANVSVEDVKTIKSGVSAAQNVARSFLGQRRAAAALRSQNDPSQSTTSTKTATTATPKQKRSVSSNLEVAVDDSEGKQSWGDWIGGYSMAITRAVKSIEHEAAMESQRPGTATNRPVQARRTSAPGTKKTGGKRPPVKAQMPSEQVHGLM